MTRPEVGILREISPGIGAVLAPNAGPMTHWGTNCYLVGERELAIIDPGPAEPIHIANLLRAIGNRMVSHILITHAHADHSAAAMALSSKTGAPIVGFGRANAGRRSVMEQLARAGHLAGGEGLDKTFAPDHEVNEGDTLRTSEFAARVLHIPGHFAGHLGFQIEDNIFVGDHVMDWSTSIVSPPDGHLADFLASCKKLISLSPSFCLTGHGGPLTDPIARLEWLVAHRKRRESQILGTLSNAPVSIETIVSRVYPDVPSNVRPAAARNVLAHLIDLWERRIIRPLPEMRWDAKFRLR
ncbi:MAG: MBL fold metallo-hydrolase [Boseongicola sp.]|nr:MBL fold metallo-hydrolase [Boseongicola sp.]